jgi:glycogen synthase
MKILMLGWELPPYNSGGLGVACYQMCKELTRNEVGVEFVLPYEPPAQTSFMKLHGANPITVQEFINLGGAYDSSFCTRCETRDCEHGYPSDLRGRQRRYIAFVEQLVQKKSYDAIHAHDWLTFEAGVRAKQITGKPLIAHVHATEFDRAGAGRGNSLVHEIEQHALMLADCIIAVSQLTKDLIVREYNIPSDKIEVVHNSIDLEDFDAIEKDNAYRYLEQMKEHGYKVVVSLSRLTMQKGIYHLLKAAQRVVAHNPKVLFLIVGDGDMRDELIQMSAEFGVAHNVIFTGFLRGKQWRDAYAIADMFVMPSVSEPFGLTALEAACYDNAVLLSKQSGVGEVLLNVMRFDFWDTEKLANCILSVTEHESLQATLAEGVRQELGTLSWQTATDRFKEIYRRHALMTGPAL